MQNAADAENRILLGDSFSLKAQYLPASETGSGQAGSQYFHRKVHWLKAVVFCPDRPSVIKAPGRIHFQRKDKEACL